MQQVNQCLDLFCRSGRHHGVTRQAGDTTLALPYEKGWGELAAVILRISGLREGMGSTNFCPSWVGASKPLRINLPLQTPRNLRVHAAW